MLLFDLDKSVDAIRLDGCLASSAVTQDLADLQIPGQNGKLLQTHVCVFAMVQSNWEAVKALALDTSCAAQQQPSSPSHDAQSTAQVSCISVCISFPCCLHSSGGQHCHKGVSKGPQGGPPGGLSLSGVSHQVFLWLITLTTWQLAK